MASSKLADRLRDVLKPAGGRRPPAQSGAGTGLCAGTTQSLEDVLGGEWRRCEEGRSFVVERRLAAQSHHGKTQVGDLAERVRRAALYAPMLSAGAPAQPPFVFLDLETTGLSGGAGTIVFLVGCGWFAEDGSFVVRQHVLTEFSDERVILGAVARDLMAAGALVSFNGKSFDAPVLETRYLFHHLEWRVASLPHIDILHPSRHFWGRDLRQSWQDAGEKRECSLSALEEHVLGVRRDGDVSGFEIPGRYFQFLRSSDARPLEAVLEHNRHDLLSLAGLTARILNLLADGPGHAADPREALALGRLYARSGLEARAANAYESALSMIDGASPGKPSMAPLRISALRELACAHRRARRFEEAAKRWRDVLDVPGCPAQAAREASEALAIHHEHRACDLMAARAFALRSLDGRARPTWNDAVQHRLARLQRKLDRSERPGFLAF